MNVKLTLSLSKLFWIFFLMIPWLAYGQTKVTGMVTDKSNLPLPGVTIKLKGTTTGTITDGSGKFSLIVKPDQSAVARFSLVGYKSKEVPIGNNTSLSVQLTEDENMLEDVV